MKTLSKMALQTMETRGRIVCKFLLFFGFVFNLRSTARRSFKELPLHSLPPFPKHDKHKTEPKKGRCRLCSPLSFYLPSPLSSLPCSSPTTWLTCALPLRWLWTESHKASPTGRAEPACRYRSSFHFSIMSLVADVHMCCPCVYPERRTFVLVLLPFTFLLWVRVEQWRQSKDAYVYERKPCIVLIVWFVESISMRWKPLL